MMQLEFFKAVLLTGKRIRRVIKWETELEQSSGEWKDYWTSFGIL